MQKCQIMNEIGEKRRRNNSLEYIYENEILKMHDDLCAVWNIMLVHSFHAYYPHRLFHHACNLPNYYTVIDIVVTTLSKLTHTQNQKQKRTHNNNNDDEHIWALQMQNSMFQAAEKSVHEFWKRVEYKKIGDNYRLPTQIAFSFVLLLQFISILVVFELDDGFFFLSKKKRIYTKNEHKRQRNIKAWNT